MTKSCNEIQESIAWGKALTEAEQSHVLSCASCSEAAMQFTQLDALMTAMMKNHSEATVPDHFADRVMSRIESQLRDETTRHEMGQDWSTSISERFLFLINLRAFQFGLVSVGVLMSLANLIRFVFAVILPVSA